MKAIAILALAGLLTGCGWFDRVSASVTGGGSTTCVAGVEYLQFASGVTVKYKPDGTVSTCK